LNELANKSASLHLTILHPVAKLAVGDILDLGRKIILQTEQQKQGQDCVSYRKLGLLIKFHALFPENRTRSSVFLEDE
jgi:hypothetical protein